MYVYILKSIKKNWFYVGMSGNVEKRFIQHNSGRVISTQYNKPYLMIYKKEFENRKNARDFEKYLKVRSNKERLLKDLGYLSF